VIRVVDLAKGQTRPVLLEPDEQSRDEIAETLGIVAVRKLRLEGQLAPRGKRDWQFTGTLGATVVQSCVVTLAPVTTRIDETVQRRWVAGWHEPEGDEVELPEDVDVEPLGAEIDLGGVMVEALALALPAFPRADDAELDETAFTEPGKEPMTDDEARPFAGLATLRDKLSGNDET
jgi:uncharacterized metal-binding protein YceD (DUF177 family)